MRVGDFPDVGGRFEKIMGDLFDQAGKIQGAAESISAAGQDLYNMYLNRDELEFEGLDEWLEKDGSIVIKDTRFTEEGENFEVSLEEMCNEPDAVWLCP